jgi:Protein of unknown function (DUF2806)
MGIGNSLISLGDLTRPATVLIEKISDAVGGVFRPYQIKRVAKAESEAEKIKALASVEISEIQQRALIRLIMEEGKKQENIESITYQALDNLKDDARPEVIEADWLVNFFEKCRLVSDKEMQSLWARLLAGEANNPGSFSKRTIEFISNLDKADAQLFTNLCSFGWFAGTYLPLIYDVKHDIFNKKNINFAALKHLDDIGLVAFNHITGYLYKGFPKTIQIHYYGTPIIIEFQQDENNELQIGHVLLTKIGQELAPICGATRFEEFIDYVLDQWQRMGYTTWSPYPNPNSSQKADAL